MRRRFLILTGMIILLTLLILPAIQISQASPAVTPIISDWHVISSGGTSYTTDGTYSLGATIGQSQVGRVTAPGYLVQVGFWIENFLHLYLPLILK